MAERRRIEGGHDRVGDLLRVAREDSGLRQSQLAERLGVSVETVSAAEAGRPMRLSTLLRYREVLGLPAEALLMRAPRFPQAASRLAWEDLKRLHGLWARRVLVSAGELRVSGLRTTDPELMSLRSVRTALMRAAFQGSAELLRELEARPDGAPVRLGDGPAVHRFRWTASGLSYRRTPGLEAALVEFPVERLAFGVSGRAAPDLSLSAVPASAPSSSLDIFPHLHPHGPAVRPSARSSWLCVSHPPVGVRFGLTRREAAPTALGARVCRARREAGLSLRELAARSGLGLGTVHRLEAGLEPRSTTLMRLLDALPTLSAAEVLPGPPVDDGWIDAWERDRLLFGLEADEIHKTVVVDERGRRTTRIETRGLRSVRGDLSEPCVRIPVLRAVVQARPDQLTEILGDAETLRVRRCRFTADGGSHEIRWPRRLDSEEGVTYVRRYEAGQANAMDEEEARRRHGGAPPYWSGVSLPLFHATRRARLTVRLPAGYEPGQVRPLLVPHALAPDPERPPIGAGEPPLVRIRRTRRLTSLDMVMRYPPAWVRPAITWRLPANRGPR